MCKQTLMTLNATGLVVEAVDEMGVGAALFAAKCLSAETLKVHDREQGCFGSKYVDRRASAASTCSDLSRLLASELSDPACDLLSEDVEVCLSTESGLGSVNVNSVWGNCTKSISNAATTYMVSNIPPRYTAEMLIEEWPNQGTGRGLTYDMLFLPRNSPTRNAGYAFIHFTSESAALDFRAFWKNKRLAHFSEKMRKGLWVSRSQEQGRTSHLEILLGRLPSKVKDTFQPILFNPSSGKRITLEQAMDIYTTGARANSKQAEALL
jgi:hypothetical protein